MKFLKRVIGESGKLSWQQAYNETIELVQCEMKENFGAQLKIPPKFE